MKQLIEKIKRHKKILLIILYTIIFVIYVAKPICFDVKIYLEAAYRADIMGRFPNNIIEQWEHKYILNRLLFYIIFKIAKLIVSVDNIILFEIVVKIIYGLMTIAIIKYFSKSTKEFFEKYDINEDTVFGILYIVLMCSGIYFFLQTEMTALLVLLIAIVFVLKKKTIYKLLSAFVISALFWLKGVTILYSVIVLIVMIIDKQNKKDIIFVICSSFAFLIGEVLILFYIEPNEIINMYLATKYITISLDWYEIIEEFVMDLFWYRWLSIGLVTFIINSICHKKVDNIKLLCIECFAWITLSIGVYIQKMIYFYQIALMTPAIIFSIFVFLYYRKKVVIKYNVYAKIIITLFLTIIISTIVIMEIYSTITIYDTTIKNLDSIRMLEEQIPDLKDGEVLYIGNGQSSYYIKAKSYMNFTTTIFLSGENDVYLNSSYINGLKDKIKDYKGKYIIIDETEFISKFRVSEDIIKFIEEEYYYKQNTGLSVYEIEQGKYVHIYERK